MQKHDTAKIAEYFSRPNGRVVLGVDGFIDQIWQIVESRESKTDCTPYRRMRDFAAALARCGEGGFAHEILDKRRTAGGFVANTGMAIGNLGVPATLVGIFGKPTLDPVFAPLAEVCEVVSIGEPCVSNNFEFDDGKMMFANVQAMMDFCWESLVEALGTETLERILASADTIALGYWSLMPAFDEIVGKICGLAPGSAVSTLKENVRMFFDFADIRKRDRRSLDTTLAKLAEFNTRIPMTLSLNENEAQQLFANFDEPFDLEGRDAETALARLRQRIGLDELLVHTPDWAAGASASEGASFIPQNRCEQPVKTTGAGDNFNGGYMAANLGSGDGKLTLSERLHVANLTTGYYVRNGHTRGLREKLRAPHRSQG